MDRNQFDLLWREVEEIRATAPQDLSLLTEGDPDHAGLFFCEGAGSDGELDLAVLRAAASRSRDLHSGTIYGLVPLYGTSICREQCLYCNYRAANNGLQIDRVRLSDEDLVREAEHLVAHKGYRVIELVYASDPRVRCDAMCRHAELVHQVLDRHGGGSVGINAESMDEEEYRRLRGAGVSFSLLWQETYDREVYATMHPGTTKKSSFDYRLESYERMLAAGFDRIGLGVLSGLADWRFDWAMLMRHEAWLQRYCGRGASVIGLPRLKPAAGADPTLVSPGMTTSQLLFAVAVHKLFAPEVLPFVSTREDWDTCVTMAAGGGCLFTFDCSTVPGGYSLGRQGSQFTTGSFPREVYGPLLEENGLRVELDWRFDGSSAGLLTSNGAAACR